ncbi:unnamed protein product (macronuclear) [Paramecium tetraurelia]|uniref:non-specific serine/threonine protein kinase n=1 Tax=Paramecium tetraurelia TaxID=5888 RepID=A0CGE9_PARTE|nr:uncharacterized protein GSPATT00007306001 [Paramecium tetraurelia]CAK69866.1 unnamed protein product [Paramecium tetraurelia]|eukprot:XP_001437263.1 hypothetical protein (macronuclear) [Paramecium tetraurelia strain d4-2]
MNTEIASFFDNPELMAKTPPLWQTLNQDIYDNDNIVFQQDCYKIAKKSKQLRPITIQLGNEHLYYLNKETIYQLQITVVMMNIIKHDEHGNIIRLSRNGKYIDLKLDDFTAFKNLLNYRCLQSTFHDEFGVTKMIGKGSFAKVYLSTKKSTGINYAVKAFNKEFMLEQFKGRESLENEIKVMRRLNQENLVRLHEVYETQNSIYFILDILKGGELLSRVKSQPLTAPNLQKLMYNLMKALCHLHSKKCIHRDLKPENLLLKEKDNDTDVVIADFGLASFLNEDILFKRCGTPGFVAPEILIYKEGDPFYDEKCDVFSAGVIFYILLTGRQPFQGTDYKAILRANKNCEINYNLKQIQTAPLQLVDLLKKMLFPEPKGRVSSEDCLKHPYFKEIFKEQDLIDVQDSLREYEKDFVYGLGKQQGPPSQVGSMQLQQRQPALNGRIDTMGSFSNVSNNGSVTRLDQKPQPQQSKFSQFSQSIKQQINSDANSPVAKKNNQSDLRKTALKNSFQQQINQMSKDDDCVNEEASHLEDAISKLNAQTPKMGLKKASSYKVQKSSME